MIQPEDNKTKDLFELLDKADKEAEAFCGIQPQVIVEMDFSEAEKRVLLMHMRALIAGVEMRGMFFLNPRTTGAKITTCIIDECMPAYESSTSVGPLKSKKAQWKNERSVFNRVNQGKKSK